MTDAAARRQAVEAVDTSIAVTAGAGSGKTTVLVRRVVRLLQGGVHPSRIAATTFTEKAAGELVERIRDAVEEAAELREPWALTASASLSELVSTTIHAFCRRLLDIVALEAGWTPGVTIDAASGANRAAIHRWRRDFDARAPEIAGLVRSVVTVGDLTRALGALLDGRDLAPIHGAPWLAPTTLDVSALHAEVRAVAAALLDASTGCKRPEACKLYLGNRALLDVAAATLAAEPLAAVSRVLLDGEEGSLRGGKAVDWVEGGKATFTDAVGEWRALPGRVRSALHGVVIHELHTHALPLALELRAASGEVTFDDLLHRALAALRDEAVRARLAARFDAVLVDEVQDTDPIQAEIALLLTQDGGAPRPGGLFAVGDPKQSIYRFRRADVDTWSRLRDAMTASGASLSLTRNFRSVPGVVAWVNHAFADMPDYEPLVAHRGPAALDPVVVLVNEEAGDAAAIAGHLLDLRAGGATVNGRPLAWRDVMVLVPSWTRAEALQRGLAEAGVDALVEGGKQFFGRDEVRACLAALRAIDDPGDAASVVFTLRALFGASHEDLLRHVAAGGSWFTTLPDPPSGPVGEALRVLAALNRRRSRDGWVRLLDAVLAEGHALAVWSLLPDGASRIANVEKLRRLVRDAEAVADGPGDVLARLRALEDADDEADVLLTDVDADVVRITTLFKAKGLEAPLVVLAEMNRVVRTPDAIPDRARAELAVKVGKLEPFDWDRRKEAERIALDAERVRWMYVAATRARDQLVICDGGKRNLVDLMRAGVPRGAEHDASIEVAPGVAVKVRLAGELAAAPTRDRTFPALDDAVVDGWITHPPTVDDPSAAWAEARARRLRDARLASVRRRSVVELARRSRFGGAGGGVGVEGGTLVHAVMNLLDLSSPDAVCRRVAAEAVARLGRGLDDDLRARCAVVVQRLLDHPVVAEARAAPERWQEVPFSASLSGVAVSGTIDLCFPTDTSRAQWVVVDWKSSLPPVGDPDRATYEQQLVLYARALLATVGAVDVRTVLVGPHEELGAPTADQAAVAAVAPGLAEGLRALLDAGAPVPAVGVRVDGVEVELLWQDARQVVLLDPEDEASARLEAAGWRVWATSGSAPSLPAPDDPRWDGVVPR
jgi:ATP-dependent exoDNAse (exonuclease V) beta subunit